MEIPSFHSKRQKCQVHIPDLAYPSMTGRTVCLCNHDINQRWSDDWKLAYLHPLRMTACLMQTYQLARMNWVINAAIELSSDWEVLDSLILN